MFDRYRHTDQSLMERLSVCTHDVALCRTAAAAAAAPFMKSEHTGQGTVLRAF